MKALFQKKTVGYYMTMLAAILSLIALFLYRGVLIKVTAPSAASAAAVVVFVLLTLLESKINSAIILRLIAFLNAVLMAFALISSIGPMINQIGFVFAGLDPMSTISAVITFAVLSGISMLLNIIASFII